MGEPSIEQLAAEWLRLDGDEQTRLEIENLLRDRNTAALELRLRRRIGFGTAGLRGRMQAGFSGMNSLIVIQASQGLAEYLLAEQKDVKSRGVVIGRDARFQSEKFAILTGSVFVKKGIKVWYFEDLVHTPLVPFAVCKLEAAAGVMITASHNPPKDNGYKVYWENGCQIIPPHDKGIATAIGKNLEPTIPMDVNHPENDALRFFFIDDRVIDAYFNAVNRSVRFGVDIDLSHIPKFMYTPMHGVGLPAMTKVTQDLGVQDKMSSVTSQAKPDPNFPTVQFPNPEEKGALEEAIKAADANSVHIILACDPDADRFSAAEKVGQSWYQFTGNEMGALLASHVWSKYKDRPDREKLVMLASTVSSRMLSKIAKDEGFMFEETLTGFKWLGNRARDARGRGLEPAFAFEEALGYMFPSIVLDKDGISAAAHFLVAAGQWAAKGKSPFQELQSLHSRHGFFAEANTYIRWPPEKISAVFKRIVSLGEPYPRQLGDTDIAYWRDLTRGYDSRTEDHVPVLPVSASSEMLTAELVNGVRLTVRGSGTEPKIKIYIDGHSSDEKEARKRVNEAQRDVLKEWFPLEELG